jgi:hypothetical protein
MMLTNINVQFHVTVYLRVARAGIDVSSRPELTRTGFRVMLSTESTLV